MNQVVVLNKLLTRILAGLVAVIVALSLFSFSIIKLTNQVRYEHYWSDLITPGLQHISANPAFLASEPLEALSLVARNQQDWGDVVQTRLHAGQVVVIEKNNRLKSVIATGEPSLALQLDARPDGEEVYRLYMAIVKAALEQADTAALRDEMDAMEHQFDLVISLLGDDVEEMSDMALESLSSTQQFLKVIDDEVQAFIRLSSGEVIALSFPDRFSAFSWFVVTLLLAFSVGCLALVVYVMLQGLDRQLRNVETVASRIARGELDARVKRASDSDAVSRLGSAFNSMADHIQRLMYIQKEMIHAVSHELRTPVARIRFGVQMIEDCPDKDSLRKQIKGIDGDIQELDELIDEILTYARLEQGGPILAFHEANVMEIVEQVVSEQSSVKPEMEIFAEYKSESELWKESEVEARYIHRSIQNLVGNATRYANSKVKVVCSFDKETCRVDVEDDGPGIPEEDWESVFTPFARLDDSRTRSSGGYGLGLSIVRRILYWHGGQAFLGRSEMGGAKFSLVWPRKQQAPQ